MASGASWLYLGGDCSLQNSWALRCHLQITKPSCRSERGQVSGTFRIIRNVDKFKKGSAYIIIPSDIRISVPNKTLEPSI